MTNGRRPGSRRVESVHLREYARAGKTPHERITAFLRDTDGASRADISGACGDSWASIHTVLARLLADGQLSIETTVKPERYRLKLPVEQRGPLYVETVLDVSTSRHKVTFGGSDPEEYEERNRQ